MDPKDEYDIGNGHEQEQEQEDDEESAPRELPPDLPRSLDDRKNFPSYSQETEYYDAWQGTARSVI